MQRSRRRKPPTHIYAAVTALTDVLDDGSITVDPADGTAPVTVAVDPTMHLITDPAVYKGLKDSLTAAAQPHNQGKHPTEWNQLASFRQQMRPPSSGRASTAPPACASSPVRRT